VENVNLAVVDRGYEQPIAYGADIVSATLQTIANHGSSPMRFEAALTTPRADHQGTGTIARASRPLTHRSKRRPSRSRRCSRSSPATRRSI